MEQRTIGDRQVGAIGLGLMTFQQSGQQPREQLLATIRAALDAGVSLFDTADAYGPDERGGDAQGANERLIASLLDELGVRDQVLLATKGGHVRTADGGWALDSTPQHLHAAVDASLRRLCVIPSPGAKRPRSIIESAAAAHLRLSPEEISELSRTA